MNKKISSKLALLLLLLLLLSLVSCGLKNPQPDIQQYTKPETQTEHQEDTEQGTQQNNQQNNQYESFIISGGNNIVPEVCEYYLSDINVTKKIEPSIITENNSYSAIQTEGKIYIDIILCVNSLSNKDNMAEDLITTNIKINNNKYSCSSLVENTDNSSLEKNDLIKPQETRIIHYITEVPIKDSTGELEIILNINGKKYINKVQL